MILLHYNKLQGEGQLATFFSPPPRKKSMFLVWESSLYMKHVALTHSPGEQKSLNFKKDIVKRRLFAYMYGGASNPIT